MTEFQDQRYTLGRNIKHLRKLCGETQTELGDALGYSKSAIGSYENGEKFPKHDTIILIAKHYGVTVDMLLHYDFSIIKKFDFPINNSNELRSFFELLTPLVKSDQAMMNADFKKAYLKAQDYLDAQAKGIPTSLTSFEIIFESFLKVVEETEIIEAKINMLWCVWQIWFSIRGNDSKDAFPSLIYKKEGRAKKLLEIRSNVTSDTLQLRHEFIDQINDLVIEILRTLKKNTKWYELADYYMALRFIYSFCDSRESDEINEQIGIHMMYSLADLKNQYAIKYIKILAPR